MIERAPQYGREDARAVRTHSAHADDASHGLRSGAFREGWVDCYRVEREGDAVQGRGHKEEDPANLGVGDEGVHDLCSGGHSAPIAAVDNGGTSARTVRATARKTSAMRAFAAVATAAEAEGHEQQQHAAWRGGSEVAEELPPPQTTTKPAPPHRPAFLSPHARAKRTRAACIMSVVVVLVEEGRHGVGAGVG